MTKTFKQKDFNSIFWRVFGVNQKVYEPLDVFKAKKDKRAVLKNNNRSTNNSIKEN